MRVFCRLFADSNIIFSTNNIIFIEVIMIAISISNIYLSDWIMHGQASQ